MVQKWYVGVQGVQGVGKGMEWPGGSMGLVNGLGDASGCWRGSEGSIDMKGGPGSVKV